MASLSSHLFLLMATSSLFLAFIITPSTPTTPITKELWLTFNNYCNSTLWPVIQPNPGHVPLGKTGFSVLPHDYLNIRVPNRHWAGRIWARTGCVRSNNTFTCETGCCGQLDCTNATASSTSPATLAELFIHHGRHSDFATYEVSLVNGFNVPMTLEGGDGEEFHWPCPKVGCQPNLLATCPEPLQQRLEKRSDRGGDGEKEEEGEVVACKSGCKAFGTDELCCKNRYSSPEMCKDSVYSKFFKRACPTASTLPYEHTKFTTPKCTSPLGIDINFCL